MSQSKMIKEAFLSGVALLYKNKDYINELNVFPVPDGDTGSNMFMTLKTASDAVNAVDTNDIEAVCKAIASGSLRGARGNSGVIMSQILRGFTNHIKEEKDINMNLFLCAITKAKETAYKAVVKPKEGTILTVISALASKAEEMLESDLSDLDRLNEVIDYGNEMLAKTPDMLPILKEAGVVDSGGQGLMFFIEGVRNYLRGDKIELDFESASSSSTGINLKVVQDQEIAFMYCTECIINREEKFKETAVEEITKYLEGIGDSLVVVSDDEYIKIHVHTNHPGKAFEKCLEYGFLSNLKVDNLKLEHQEKVIKDAENKSKEFNKVSKEQKQEKLKNIGFVAVSSGEGLTTLFNDLGCDMVIEGGQTMNPSIDDFVKAIEKVHAKNVFVFPNNSNVIMAAKHSKEIITDKNVYIVETKNVLQGINSLIYYTENEDMEELLNSFKETISNMKTIETTYAVRNTTIDGIDIKENDYISLGEKGLLATNSDLVKSIIEAYNKIKNENDSLITIYYGEGIKEEEANNLKNELEKINSNVEINIFEGKQPVYYYYISVE